LRGTKLGELLPCSVITSGLQSFEDAKSDARSLNHAYSRISEACEPHRTSHTGNVFDKVFFLDTQERPHPIADRRNALEAEAEYALTVLSMPWWLLDAAGLHRLWAHLGCDIRNLWVASLINDRSIVCAQHYFTGEGEAHSWLERAGYELVQFEQTRLQGWPPEPPYRLPCGEEHSLPWRRG
jgi:hypothetical protein